MANAHDNLTLQMLDWLQQRPHSYSEVMEVWRSSCPRLTIWEDACADGLIASEGGASGQVFVSEKGRRLLQSAGGRH
ncbi:hypothetical protein D0T25_04175 [Duganella sp. BJB488]|uniref:hypothetical protein n=1 Tax=unclassified Duganella TaxID=2636909 RepID=UPI000E343C39|nr:MULTISPECIES: hypothetical protein [unclassified Duganella]NVD70512.1 hypothetical protein [Duganella sp. BJB1802]RFP24231.1 hypothetical protein D0T26_04215 [Duganella sp. BJB489]RFP27028.1 hypothetical protein D0T25_04175 [Duganella sp. BJB488]RFP34675.1 hypothetical protein D0T24_13855 [Duganella sp. BJB480]